MKTKVNPRQFPLETVLVEHSTYRTGTLKHRLIAANILENRCTECGLGSEWNKKKITLVLDHKNGIKTDHRLENLRILCPNCHSQTPTFAGRNIKNKRNIA